MGRRLPRPLSLSDFEPNFFIRRVSAARPIRPAPAADFFLAGSAVPATHGRQAIAPRARRSLATAPGSNEAPLLRWWRRWFSDFARRTRGTEGSTETVLVNHYGWNSRNLLAAPRH